MFPVSAGFLLIIWLVGNAATMLKTVQNSNPHRLSTYTADGTVAVAPWLLLCSYCLFIYKVSICTQTEYIVSSYNIHVAVGRDHITSGGASVCACFFICGTTISRFTTHTHTQLWSVICFAALLRGPLPEAAQDYRRWSPPPRKENKTHKHKHQPDCVHSYAECIRVCVRACVCVSVCALFDADIHTDRLACGRASETGLREDTVYSQ